MKINQDVFIQQGILDCQIDQLITYSNTDPEIKKSTSDPTRFKDRAAFDQWLTKGRIIYTLVDKNNNLFGITWFGPKIPPVKLDPKFNFTFSIRLYDQARGQGLSYPFLKTTFNDVLKSSKDEVTGFWLQVSKDNVPAIHTYKKIGFKKVKQIGDKIIMTHEICSKKDQV